MRAEQRTLLCQITCDFLVPGDKRNGPCDPLMFAPEGPSALRSAAVLAELEGTLAAGLEELLELTYWLDGKGDSRSAATAIRAAICTVPEAAAALGAGDELDVPTLIELAKKRARRAASAPMALQRPRPRA